MNPQDSARRLREAKSAARPVPQLTAGWPDLSVATAYEIQQLVTAGQPRGGWKMGLTSLAKQREVGVSSPIRGILMADDRIEDGGTVARSRFIHPRAEPEIVFVLERELSAGTIRSAIRSAHVGIEVIDSRYQNFRFTLPDVIADNTSASGWVIGEEIRLGLAALPEMEVWIARNGVVAHRAPASAILGDPLRSLEELVRLTPEMIGAGPVLAGGVTQSVPFDVGDLIEVGCAAGSRASFRVQ
jgi:2-keto-4-pentenoate hydratase